VEFHDVDARSNAKRDGAEPPLAAASVANVENCFIKSDVDFTAAGRLAPAIG